MKYKTYQTEDGHTKADCPVCEASEHIQILEEHGICEICQLEGRVVTNSAEFVKEVSVKDPASGGFVEMSVFKHNDTGGMFAVDSSYLDQCFDDDTDPVIPDPFSMNLKGATTYNVKLYGL